MSLAIATQPSDIVAVTQQCDVIEQWAESCDSVPELTDASHKLGAIDQYLAKTTTEGRSRVAAAMRRLEVRIGELLGPAPGHGPGRGNLNRDEGLSPQERHAFRKMAEHRDAVESEIDKSTDDAPASRRSVLAAIKQAGKDRQAAEDAALDDEIDRLGIQRDDPETAKRNKHAAESIGAVRSAIDAVNRSSNGLDPAGWVAKFSAVGPYSASNLPLEQMEQAGRWLIDTAKEISQ